MKRVYSSRDDRQQLVAGEASSSLDAVGELDVEVERVELIGAQQREGGGTHASVFFLAENHQLDQRVLPQLSALFQHPHLFLEVSLAVQVARLHDEQRQAALAGVLVGLELAVDLPQLFR